MTRWGSYVTYIIGVKAERNARRQSSPEEEGGTPMERPEPSRGGSYFSSKTSILKHTGMTSPPVRSEEDIFSHIPVVKFEDKSSGL
jgi:hypothetical protein